MYKVAFLHLFMYVKISMYKSPDEGLGLHSFSRESLLSWQNAYVIHTTNNELVIVFTCHIILLLALYTIYLS